MKIHRLLLIVLGLITAALPASPQERERITSFHADIRVNTDASLTITETIRVYAAGNSIQRGIFRVQPARYPVIRVERDGEPEPYHIAKAIPGQTVYFGQEDILLDPGFYTYTFEYTVSHEVRDFELNDEVYWNVTGNAWSFPIESATCAITLPPGIGADTIHSEAYTGYDGDQGQDYTTSVDENGVVHFETTRTLNTAEGLTVVVTFPKGHVEHPKWYARYIPNSLDSTASRIALSIPVLLLVYFFVIWFMVGRDPRQGRIIPVNHPPEGISPATAQYIMNMGYDKTCYTVSLISLAIKGALRIGQETHELGPFKNTVYTLEQTEDAPDDLTEDERAVKQKLFASDSVVEISRSKQTPLLTSQKALKTSLKERCKDIYFNRNGKYLLQGVILMYLLLIWAGYLHGLEAFIVVMFMSVWLSIWTMAVLGMWKGIYGMLKGAITERSIAQGIGGIVMFIFTIPFTAGEVFGFGMLAGIVSIEFAFSVMLSAVIVIVFAWLLKAPTREGREVLDQLEAFKLFLSGESTNRFASEHDLSFQEQFERHLPYAIALGLEQEWSKAFEAGLNKMSMATGASQHRRTHYQPAWYNTGSGQAINVGAFGSTLSTAFASALSSASSSSSSSSGSGGGGSSGGGGGGGGGGGW